MLFNFLFYDYETDSVRYDDVIKGHKKKLIF